MTVRISDSTALHKHLADFDGGKAFGIHADNNMQRGFGHLGIGNGAFSSGIASRASTVSAVMPGNSPPV